MTHLHNKWIPVEDSHVADISSHVWEALDFTDCVGRILVPCEVVISCSITICVSYLVKT